MAGDKPTPKPTPTATPKTDTNTLLAALDAALSGGGTDGATGYTNQVYLGPTESKTVRMKRSGQTISVPAGDKTMTIQEAKAFLRTFDPTVVYAPSPEEMIEAERKRNKNKKTLERRKRKWSQISEEENVITKLEV